MALEPQQYIAARCEEDLRRYGDSFRGVGYTKSESDQQHRYALMLDIVREVEPVSVLDLGCGLAHMLDHIERDPTLRHIRYSGLDISEEYLAQARRRHPDADLSLRDVLKDDDDLPEYDYVLQQHLQLARRASVGRDAGVLAANADCRLPPRSPRSRVQRHVEDRGMGTG